MTASSRFTRRLLPLALIMMLLTPAALAVNVASESNRSPALCAAGDPNPEPGVQGDVPSGATPNWDCGVTPVGFLAGADGAMAVAGTCAYTGGGLETGGGVRVIDVSDPAHPTLAKVLETSSRELLAATMVGDRALLATRRRVTQQEQGYVLGRDVLVDVWDIHTCTDPKLLGTVRFPTASKVVGDPDELGSPAHNLKFNPSGTKLYGSIPTTEVDLTDLDHPENWTSRSLHCAIGDQGYDPYKAAPGTCEALYAVALTPGRWPEMDHEPAFNPDGTRMYLGAQIPGYQTNSMRVIDITGPDPKVLSVTENAPGHGVDFATIGGRQYLLHSNEIGAISCIPGQVKPNSLGHGDRAFLLDITTETAPVKTSELELADSKFENCGPNNTGGPSTAYHDIDNPLDTRYAVIGFESAGFRFFDIRDPKHPVEVAYFNRGRSTHTKPYIIPETGQIWVSGAGGFWVLQLEPQVRQALGLDA